jgi:hypothetical protein
MIGEYLYRVEETISFHYRVIIRPRNEGGIGLARQSVKASEEGPFDRQAGLLVGRDHLR